MVILQTKLDDGILRMEARIQLKINEPLQNNTETLQKLKEEAIVLKGS